MVTADDEADDELWPALAMVWSERPPNIFQCGCAARGSQARVVASCRAQASPVLALGCPNQDLALVCSLHWVPCSQHRGPGVVLPTAPPLLPGLPGSIVGSSISWYVQRSKCVYVSQDRTDFYLPVLLTIISPPSFYLASFTRNFFSFSSATVMPSLYDASGMV